MHLIHTLFMVALLVGAVPATSFAGPPAPDVVRAHARIIELDAITAPSARDRIQLVQALLVIGRCGDGPDRLAAFERLRADPELAKEHRALPHTWHDDLVVLHARAGVGDLDGAVLGVDAFLRAHPQFGRPLAVHADDPVRPALEPNAEWPPPRDADGALRGIEPGAHVGLAVQAMLWRWETTRPERAERVRALAEGWAQPDARRYAEGLDYGMSLASDLVVLGERARAAEIARETLRTFSALPHVEQAQFGRSRLFDLLRIEYFATQGDSQDFVRHAEAYRARTAAMLPGATRTKEELLHPMRAFVRQERTAGRMRPLPVQPVATGKPQE